MLRLKITVMTIKKRKNLLRYVFNQVEVANFKDLKAIG